MSTRRQRQILRNRKLEFQRTMAENEKKAKAKPKAEPKEEPKKDETKIVKKKKTTKKEDK